MRVIIIIMLLSVILSALLSPLSAAIIYVNPNAPGLTLDGKSWQTAFRQIQDGINAAVAGDQVWVKEGRYVGPIGIRSAIGIYGGFVGNETELSQRDAYRHRTIVDGNNGTYAVYCNADAVIDSFIIRKATYGIRCYNCKPRISGNFLTANGTGIHCYGSEVVAVNNIITSNSTGIICYSGSVTVTSNTIVGNSTYGINIFQGSGQVSNNIIAFNYRGITKYSSAIAILTCNDVYGNLFQAYQGLDPGSGDISTDPVFVSLESGNLHIKPGSPCIDAGTNSALGLPSTDTDGQARVQGAKVDIGADECDGTTMESPSLVIYVNKAAPDGGHGRTWEDALQTIHEAIDTAVLLGATEIWVAKGEYFEEVRLPPFTKLYGGFSGYEIDPTLRGFNSRGSMIPRSIYGQFATTIDGFTITDNSTGIYCNYPCITVKSCRISGANTGISCSGSSGTISGNYITLCNSAIQLVSSSNIAITSNGLINNNDGIIANTGTIAFNNNTIVGCGGKGISCDVASISATNNIFAFNNIAVSCNTGSVLLSNNCVYDNLISYSGVSAGVNDFIADPQFVSYETEDIHIMFSSPCRNRGDNTVPVTSECDVDGDIRRQEDVIDVGADETDGKTLPPPYNVIYVNASAAVGGDGKSWSTAYTTIQSAAYEARASNGAQIWVAKGTYYGGVSLERAIYLLGGFTGTETAISQRDYRHNLTTIDGGGSASGVVSGSLVDGFTIRNCLHGISNNTYENKGNHRIQNNTIINCSSGGIYCDGGYFTIKGNTIYRNSGDGIRAINSSEVSIIGNLIAESATGISGDNSTLNIVSNIIRDNAATGISTTLCTTTITNNTIVSNATGVETSGTVINNIIAFNATGLSNYGSLTSNCLYGNTKNYVNPPAVSTDLYVDPEFANYRYRDLHIQPTSKCRDAGVDSSSLDIVGDIDRQNRIQGTAVDIGADESDGTAWVPESRVIYVDGSISESGDGTSWGRAFKSLKSALLQASDMVGVDVWVRKGVYRETVIIPSITYVYGGFNGDETDRGQRNWQTHKTMVDGSISTDAVTVGTASAFDGFIVKLAKYGIKCIGNSPVVENNKVIESLDTGILLSGNGAPLIRNNTVAFTEKYGIAGGSQANLYPRIINNTVVGCKTGGIQVSAGVLQNNIVASNSTGIMGSGGLVSLFNNNTYNNIDQSGVQRNYSGIIPNSSNLSLDPQFVSYESLNLHIRATSPCRNAGKNTVLDLPECDFDGQPRIQEGFVDIGADESDGTTPNIEPVFVNSTLPEDGDGKSWMTAYQSITTALNDISARAGSEIWVASGTYQGGFAIVSFVQMYGGFVGNESRRDQRNVWRNKTVIDGKGSLKTYLNGTYPRIDGFVITNGQGISLNGTSVIAANNIITKNKSTSLDLVWGTPIAIGNLVAKNDGYGIRCWTAPGVILNNTIVDNSTIGLNVGGSTQSVANNIVAFNGTGVNCGNLSSVFSHNDVFGNAVDYTAGSKRGVTDISFDPLFVDKASDNYQLRPGSPCIDAGISSDMLTQKDLNGNPRLKDGNCDSISVVDMGCFETPTCYVDIATAKGLPDGKVVGIASVVSTAALSDRSYVESPNRTHAIGVVGESLTVGRSIYLEGSMITVNGERMVLPSVISEGPTASVPSPFMMGISSLGGGPLGLQQGVYDYRMVKNPVTGTWSKQLIMYGGANNIGLLTKMTGRVTATGSRYFYIDDGSNIEDGNNEIKGVRVDWPYTEAMPSVGTFLEIVGISSCDIHHAPEKDVLVRLLRPVSATAVRMLQ